MIRLWERFMNASIDAFVAVLIEWRIRRWIRRTFPNQTLQRLRLHLQEETAELDEALDLGNFDKIREEIADVGILLVAVALRTRTTLANEMWLKQIDNERYRWRYDPERGYDKKIRREERSR